VSTAGISPARQRVAYGADLLGVIGGIATAILLVLNRPASAWDLAAQVGLGAAVVGVAGIIASLLWEWLSSPPSIWLSIISAVFVIAGLVGVGRYPESDTGAASTHTTEDESSDATGETTTTTAATDSSPASSTPDGGDTGPGTGPNTTRRTAPPTSTTTTTTTTTVPPTTTTQAPVLLGSTATVTEQQGSLGADTFAVPQQASGPGPRIEPWAFVEVSCKVYAPQIVSANPDGYWYRLASSPWNDGYFAVANTFWNGDVPGQEPYTHYTDYNVPDC